MQNTINTITSCFTATRFFPSKIILLSPSLAYVTGNILLIYTAVLPMLSTDTIPEKNICGITTIGTNCII